MARYSEHKLTAFLDTRQIPSQETKRSSGFQNFPTFVETEVPLVHLTERRTSICSVTDVLNSYRHIVCIFILSYHPSLATRVSYLQAFTLIFSLFLN
jgi:hypothetical protein